jgi:hypothetical protein
MTTIGYKQYIGEVKTINKFRVLDIIDTVSGRLIKRLMINYGQNAMDLLINFAK